MDVGQAVFNLLGQMFPLRGGLGLFALIGREAFFTQQANGPVPLLA